MSHLTLIAPTDPLVFMLMWNMIVWYVIDIENFIQLIIIVNFIFQIFHMCDEDGRRIPYMCANETSFNQKFRVCDWNYNVDCESSPDW